MKTYFLRTHVFLCEVDDGAIFLDLQNDSYLGINARDVRTVRDRIDGWRAVGICERDTSDELAAHGEQLIEALAKRGLLTENPAEGKSMARLHLEATAAIEFQGSMPQERPMNFVHIARFIAAYVAAAYKLRRHSLLDIAAGIVSRKKGHTAQSKRDLDVVVDLVKIFRRLTPFFYTAKDACLFDSLALVEFLYRYRIFPTLVFGVDTRPFQAHSWVQYETLVLNDYLDRARQHHPILAL